jgi:MFS family permease
MKNLKTLLELRLFLLLWISQSISTCGTAMTNYAIIIWVYKQKGTTLSISLLFVCSFLPYVLFAFVAGAVSERWNKKIIILVCDFFAACATLTLLLLYNANDLSVFHIYIINFILSFMNAFQSPSSNVLVSLITPKKYYIKVSGLQSFTLSLNTVLTPVLATVVITLGGLNTVLFSDLLSFLIGFVILSRVKISKINKGGDKRVSFIQNMTEGLKFLKINKALLNIILFFSLVNLLASIAGNRILPVMILAKTNNNELILGTVTSFIGIGTLLGSILVTVIKINTDKIKIIFISCAISFLGNVLWAVGPNYYFWIFAAIVVNLPIPFITANMTTIMRDNIPINLQGRVFSIRDTLQYITIPIGYFLSGFLADNIFEPLMLNDNRIQFILSYAVGDIKGSGICLMLLITGIFGFFICIINRKNPVYKKLK